MEIVYNVVMGCMYFLIRHHILFLLLRNENYVPFPLQIWFRLSLVIYCSECRSHLIFAVCVSMSCRGSLAGSLQVTESPLLLVVPEMSLSAIKTSHRAEVLLPPDVTELSTAW